MARAAGNKSYYTLRLERLGGEIDPQVEIRLPSVTSIIHATLAAPELVGWAYRQTLENVDLMLSHWAENGGMTKEEFVDAVLNEDFDQGLADLRLRPEDVRDIRSEEGNAAHEYLSELAVAHYKPPSNPFEKAIENWWFETAGFTRGAQPEASEAFVYSLRNSYAGTADLIYWDVNGKLQVLDLKTRAATFWSGTPRTEAYFSDRIQSVAYAGAWEEMTGQKVAGTKVLVALDNGRFIEDSTVVKWDVWAALKTVYDNLPDRSKR